MDELTPLVHLTGEDVLPW